MNEMTMKDTKLKSEYTKAKSGHQNNNNDNDNDNDNSESINNDYDSDYDSEDESSDISNSIASVFNNVFWLISLLFWASIYIAAFENLSTPLCKTKGKYNEKVPCNMWLRHRPDSEPYMIERNNLEELQYKVTYPVKMALAYSKLYEEEPNPKINWFFRKTYDPIGDYTADVLIESWSWNREMLYKIIVAFAGIYGLKDRIDSQKGNPNETMKDTISSIGKYVIGYGWINIIPLTISIISLIAPVSGIVGLFTKSISANLIVRSFFYYVLLIWLIPAIVIYFVQYVHNHALIYYAAYKTRTSKYGPVATFIYLMKRYRFLVYLNVILSGITISTKGKHSLGMSMLLLLLPLFIAKHIVTDTTTKAPNWMFSNSFTSFFAGLYEYNNSPNYRKHDSYNIFKWKVREAYPNEKKEVDSKSFMAKLFFGFGFLSNLAEKWIDSDDNEKCDDSADILKTFVNG